MHTPSLERRAKMTDDHMEKKTRGGRRSGAGRPALHVVRKNVTITMQHWQWLEKFGNASEKIRQLIDEAIQKENENL
ncbi:MAG: DUF2239 family protein [Anaerolineaceae bacterium]|nr:DUF2239 family protein [Anaerolineaceae bacterium]